MPPIDQTDSLYRKLSLALLFFCVLLGFTTIGDYGMGWDEVTRWKSGDLKVDYYKELLQSDDRMSVVKSVPRESYPGFFDMNLSMLHQATGWNRFLLGHWQAFIFGLVGLIALWRIGSIFGGARLGFWSVVLMLLTPTFYGHWFHNPKDVPFAAVYTVGLWAMIECLRRYPVLKKRWVLASAVAIGLCMATRIAGMVLLAYFVAGVGVVTLLKLWEKRAGFRWQAALRASLPWLIALPIVGLVAYLTLLPWWPSSHKDLLSVSSSTLQQLHTRASEIPLFFRGNLIWAADAPFYYTLWMFAIKATELMLMGLLLCLPFSWIRLRTHLKAGGSLQSAPALIVLILGGFFPLFYLTLTAPALHNGARHFLFAFPALCVCAAWAYLELGDWLRAHRRSMWRLAQLGFGLLLLLPVVSLVRLHPYQYVYFNSLVGGPSGAFGSYETEYWFTSSKQAVEQLDVYRKEHPTRIPAGRAARVFILGPWQVAEPFLADGFELSSDAATADFYILNTQMLMHTRFEGEEVFRIERMGVPICIVLRPEPSVRF
ncbi:ArnT family glycosyltransferase [Coraliomargarita sp. W4R53]